MCICTQFGYNACIMLYNMYVIFIAYVLFRRSKSDLGLEQTQLRRIQFMALCPKQPSDYALIRYWSIINVYVLAVILDRPSYSIGIVGSPVHICFKVCAIWTLTKHLQRHTQEPCGVHMWRQSVLKRLASTCGSLTAAPLVPTGSPQHPLPTSFSCEVMI